MTISFNQNLCNYFTVRKIFISFGAAALEYRPVFKKETRKAQALTLHHECEGTLKDQISLSLKPVKEEKSVYSEVIFTQSTLG